MSNKQAPEQGARNEIDKKLRAYLKIKFDSTIEI
jgi:hypothetical protein